MSIVQVVSERAGRVRERWWIPAWAGLASVALGLSVLAAGWSAGSLAVVTGVLFIVRGAAVALNPVTGVVYGTLASEIRTVTRAPAGTAEGAKR